MRVAIFLFALFLSIQSNAQLSLPFSVQYFSGSIKLTDSLLIKNVVKEKVGGLPNFEITILDTAALIRPYDRERERAERIIGAGFRSHTIFVDLKNQRQYFQSEPYGLKKFLVSENYRDTQYDLKNDSMTILGYTCYKAVEKTGDQHYTSKVMWYAPSLPHPIYFNGFTGLPGLVLASEFIKGGYRHVVIAKEIITETRTIVKPFKGKQVSQQEFSKAFETLRQKMSY